MLTRKLKRNLIATFSLLALGLTIASPITQTFANEDESKVKEGLTDYQGDLKYSHEVLGKFTGDTPDEREQTFRYLFSRIAQPQYINNVSDGVDPKGADTSLIKNGQACDPSRPNNLIDSNCNIPNFSAQLAQAVMRAINPGGIVGAERQPARPAFGWGVPGSIPTGVVPVDENQRSNKYTGLEVFGYNLNYTDYNGEWDDIIPSTRARMLANFGFMDKISLTGTAIWDGVSSGISEFVEGLEWNPTTWLGNISNSLEAGASSPFITIIDTSDRNIVTSHAWTRSGNSVSDSFYNVKALTDKEVMEATTIRVANRFTSMLMKEVEGDSELAAVLALESPPNFVYNPNLESEKSKKARAKAESTNKEIEAHNKVVDAHNAEVEETGEGEKKERKDKVKVPAKEFVPESEQFAKFKKDDGRVKQGEAKGITCSDIDNYSEYKSCWSEKWTSYRSSEFNAKSSVLTKLIAKVQKNLFKGDPYSDPSQAISHYVCTDSKGNAMKDANGNYEYLYTKPNEGTKQFLNPKCSLVRPTIQGGYFGDGYGKGSEITDTRHISNVSGASVMGSIPVIGDVAKAIQNGSRAISKFVAQLINEMLNLAFSPLMEKLGVTTIVKSSMESFKKTIFFPLMVIVVMAAGLMMIWDVVRSRNATKFFTGLLSMFIIFFFGVTVLNSPDKVVDFFDELPAKGEQMIAGLILSNDNSDKLCSTSSTDSNHGLRSAQCNIWQTLVYQPWVYGQWGTSGANLNAKGAGGNTLNNTNGNLVGDAPVNLGGGSKLNNWALYQLKLMTSGTITTDDSSKPIGKIDSSMYKIVDAQAGPNNAAGRDTRYFTTWQGSGSSRMITSIESAALSLFTLIVVGGLLLIKIELTFIFSMMMLGLPFILLYGITPKGKTKLMSYLATMFALLLKRILATALISLLLVLMNMVVPENASSYHMVFLSSIVVLGFFQMYKKEIFNLFNLSPENAFAGEGFLSGDPGALRAAISENTPKAIKNRAFMMSNGIKGSASGQIGGAIGGARAAWNSMRSEGKANNKFIDKSPSSILRELSSGAKSGASYGRQSGQLAQEQRARNIMTRKGIDVFTMNAEVRDEITRIGSDRIEDGTEGLASQVNKEVNAKRDFKREDSVVPMSAKEQKQVRKIAKSIEKSIDSHRDSSVTDDKQYESRRAVVDQLDEATKSRDKKDVRDNSFNKFRIHKTKDGLIHNSVKVGTTVKEISENAPHTIDEYSKGRYDKLIDDQADINPTSEDITISQVEEPSMNTDSSRVEFGAPTDHLSSIDKDIEDVTSLVTDSEELLVSNDDSVNEDSQQEIDSIYNQLTSSSSDETDSPITGNEMDDKVESTVSNELSSNLNANQRNNKSIEIDTTKQELELKVNPTSNEEDTVTDEELIAPKVTESKAPDKSELLNHDMAIDMPDIADNEREVEHDSKETLANDGFLNEPTSLKEGLQSGSDSIESLKNKLTVDVNDLKYSPEKQSESKSVDDKVTPNETFEDLSTSSTQGSTDVNPSDNLRESKFPKLTLPSLEDGDKVTKVETKFSKFKTSKSNSERLSEIKNSNRSKLDAISKDTDKFSKLRNNTDKINGLRNNTDKIDELRNNLDKLGGDEHDKDN